MTVEVPLFKLVDHIISQAGTERSLSPNVAKCRQIHSRLLRDVLRNSTVTFCSGAQILWRRTILETLSEKNLAETILAPHIDVVAKCREIPANHAPAQTGVPG